MITHYESQTPVSPFIRALGVSYASATTLTVAAGSCSDSTNSYIIRIDSPITLNAATVGLNGIDTGSLGSSVIYNVFAISSALKGYTQGVILSSSVTPLLPAGYDIYRRIGYAVTDIGNNFMKLYQFGLGDKRVYRYDVANSVLSNGAATVYETISLIQAVPPVATQVFFACKHRPFAAGDYGYLRPTGSSSAGSVTFSSVVQTVDHYFQIECPCRLDIYNDPSVEYKVMNNDLLSIDVIGFVDNL
jgi:hypothetical protein